jgi:16S rRNA (cytosine1402-N4)-methyltransferase
VIEAILKQRKEQPLMTTQALSVLIEKTDGWRKRGQHPATKYFLALRLEVNEELRQLQQALPNFINALAPHGRLLVITFHSLEDRIVKYNLRESPFGRLVNKKVIQPMRDEQLKNPRSRSAKLRVLERTS